MGSEHFTKENKNQEMWSLITSGNFDTVTMPIEEGRKLWRMVNEGSGSAKGEQRLLHQRFGAFNSDKCLGLGVHVSREVQHSFVVCPCEDVFVQLDSFGATSSGACRYFCCLLSHVPVLISYGFWLYCCVYCAAATPNSE